MAGTQLQKAAIIELSDDLEEAQQELRDASLFKDRALTAAKFLSKRQKLDFATAARSPHDEKLWAVLKARTHDLHKLNAWSMAQKCSMLFHEIEIIRGTDVCMPDAKDLNGCESTGMVEEENCELQEKLPLFVLGKDNVTLELNAEHPNAARYRGRVTEHGPTHGKPYEFRVAMSTPAVAEDTSMDMPAEFSASNGRTDFEALSDMRHCNTSAVTLPEVSGEAVDILFAAPNLSLQETLTSTAVDFSAPCRGTQIGQVAKGVNPLAPWLASEEHSEGPDLVELVTQPTAWELSMNPYAPVLFGCIREHPDNQPCSRGCRRYALCTLSSPLRSELIRAEDFSLLAQTASDYDLEDALNEMPPNVTYSDEYWADSDDGEDAPEYGAMIADLDKKEILQELGAESPCPSGDDSWEGRHLRELVSQQEQDTVSTLPSPTRPPGIPVSTNAARLPMAVPQPLDTNISPQTPESQPTADSEVISRINDLACCPTDVDPLCYIGKALQVQVSFDAANNGQDPRPKPTHSLLPVRGRRLRSSGSATITMLPTVEEETSPERSTFDQQSTRGRSRDSR
jgi:hypothetical protein